LLKRAKVGLIAAIIVPHEYRRKSGPDSLPSSSCDTPYRSKYDSFGYLDSPSANDPLRPVAGENSITTSQENLPEHVPTACSRCFRLFARTEIRLPRGSGNLSLQISDGLRVRMKGGGSGWILSTRNITEPPAMATPE